MHYMCLDVFLTSHRHKHCKLTCTHVNTSTYTCRNIHPPWGRAQGAYYLCLDTFWAHQRHEHALLADIHTYIFLDHQRHRHCTLAYIHIRSHASRLQDFQDATSKTHAAARSALALTGTDSLVHWIIFVSGLWCKNKSECKVLLPRAD